MILRHSIAVVMFCCALLLTQCKGDCHKHDTCDPIHYKLNIDIGFDYFIFKKNSYWIYKDTKTGAIDTQTCLGYRIDTVFHKGEYEPRNNISIEYPRYYSQLYSSYYKWYIYQETGPHYADDPGITDPKVILTRYVQSGLVVCFFNPFNKDFITGTGSHSCKLIGFDSTFVLQGKTYENVAKFFIDRDNTWGNDPSNTDASVNYYWAKGVGLIKKESTNNSGNWELIEYNIIQ
ncbi:MAG TPA: hypothetical protein VGF79_04075 [Bacteroidia bacterium]